MTSSGPITESGWVTESSCHVYAVGFDPMDGQETVILKNGEVEDGEPAWILTGHRRQVSLARGLAFPRGLSVSFVGSGVVFVLYELD